MNAKCSAAAVVDTVAATVRLVADGAPSNFPVRPTEHIAPCLMEGEEVAMAALEQGLLHEAVAAFFPLGSASASASESPLPCKQALQKHTVGPCSRN